MFTILKIICESFSTRQFKRKRTKRKPAKEEEKKIGRKEKRSGKKRRGGGRGRRGRRDLPRLLSSIPVASEKKSFPNSFHLVRTVSVTPTTKYRPQGLFGE